MHPRDGRVAIDHQVVVGALADGDRAGATRRGRPDRVPSVRTARVSPRPPPPARIVLRRATARPLRAASAPPGGRVVRSARRFTRSGTGHVHTAEGTVIDVSALPARRRWLPVTLSTPAGLERWPMVATVVLGRLVRSRRHRAPPSIAAPPPTTWSARPRRCSSTPRTSTSRSPTQMPPPRRASCAPGSSHASCAPRYFDDIRRASKRLTAVSATDPGRDRGRRQTLAEELPSTSTWSRRRGPTAASGFPVGAAYLRDASELMRTEILPAATAIYEDAALELDERYVDGTSAGRRRRPGRRRGRGLAAVLFTQLFVTARSRRCSTSGSDRRDLRRRRRRGGLARPRPPGRSLESRDEGADLVARCRRRGSSRSGRSATRTST